MLNSPALTAFDFFAGGGGASLGLHRAGINVLAALNHSPVAIATHAANFIDAKHLLCDIRVQKSWGLGHADIMWASPDCTHHSIAKGGQSRDAKERALAEELPRFAYNLNVNCIMVENVKEFLDWGPVHQVNGKMLPDKTRKGEHYRAWVATLAALGFVNYEYRLLNSADFGVPQSRVRYFGIFTRRGVPICWPTPTHDRHGKDGLPKWAAVRTVLDLSDRGRSIFTAWGKPIADKTLARILAGLKKHVIGKGEPQFLDKRTSNPPSGKPSSGASVGQPAPTTATCYFPDLVTPVFVLNPAWGGGSRSGADASQVIVARQDKGPLSIASAHFLPGFVTAGHGCNPPYSVAQSAKTIVASRRHPYLAQPRTAPNYLIHHYSGGGQDSSLYCPHPASTCNPHGRLVTPVFVAQYNGGSDNCRVLDVNGCLNTVPTENRFAQVSISFLTQSNGVNKGISPAAKTWRLDTATRTLTARPNQPLVQCLLQANGTRANDLASRLTMPLAGQAPVLNTNGGNLYLMTYYGTGRLQTDARPCCTVPTHDKAALVRFVGGWPSLAVAPQLGDSEAMAVLKKVCRWHGIADIYMRMLKVSELKLIMGFPADYYLAGSATKQKEMLGNAVVPQVSEAIARAMTPGLVAARLRKLPALRRAAVNRYEQGALFGKEVAAV
jgi:DNA (cytosine-5)-methyltransferase 1